MKKLKVSISKSIEFLFKHITIIIIAKKKGFKAFP